MVFVIKLSILWYLLDNLLITLSDKLTFAQEFTFSKFIF